MFLCLQLVRLIGDVLQYLSHVTIVHQICSSCLSTTLPVQVFRMAKKYPLLIQRSRPLRDSQEPKKKINSCESFFRKSLFCTFSRINPEFDRPWDTLQKNFLIAIFIILQKNNFGQKKFSNFMHQFKSAILAIWQFFQNGTFEPVHKI